MLSVALRTYAVVLIVLAGIVGVALFVTLLIARSARNLGSVSARWIAEHTADSPTP